MWYVLCRLYVRLRCFVVRGGIYVCNSYVFSVVIMYLDHLKFCDFYIKG